MYQVLVDCFVLWSVELKHFGQHEGAKQGLIRRDDLTIIECAYKGSYNFGTWFESNQQSLSNKQSESQLKGKLKVATEGI